MVRGLWPIQKFLMSSWHLLPRSDVFRKRRKACQPIPGSSSCMALRRSVSQRSSMLLCRCGVPSGRFCRADPISLTGNFAVILGWSFICLHSVTFVSKITRQEPTEGPGLWPYVPSGSVRVLSVVARSKRRHGQLNLVLSLACDRPSMPDNEPWP
jgi:hypothetical protein